MAVFTNKDYNFEDLPEIIKNYRWLQKFWVENMINRPIEIQWTPRTPPYYKL